jgi:hypothetical protein
VWIDVCAGWRQMPQESSAGIRQDSVWLEIPRLHGPVRKDVVISSQWVSVAVKCVCMRTVSSQPSCKIRPGTCMLVVIGSVQVRPNIQQPTEPEVIWYRCSAAKCASSRHSCLTVPGMRLLAPRRCCAAGGALCCWVLQGAAVQPTQTAVSTQPTQRIQDSANDQQQAGM